MIIVAGRIFVRAGARDRFLALSAKSIVEARRAAGCRDFVVAPDPLDENRVNVYEEWDSRDALTAFRGAGPDGELSSLIESAQVAEHSVSPADSR